MKKMVKKIMLLYLLSGICQAGNGLELRLAEVDLDTAAKKATSQNEKRLLDAKTMTIDGRKTHVIKVLTKDGRVRNIMIDSETGKQVGIDKD